METLLSFLSDLILFTAGLFVVVFWIIVFVIVVDEIIDMIVEHRNAKINNKNEEEL
jgi:F0F1-type ATP synthase membrane subunit b/b'